MRARIRLALIEGGYAVLVGAIIGAGGAIVLFVGVRHVQQGRVTLGELLLVMGYLSQLYAPIKTMARKAGSLQNHLASAERGFDLLDELPTFRNEPRRGRLTAPRVRSSFATCRFAYGAGPLRARTTSRSASRPGTRVGIAGATGAGKTTLVSLLARFYDPSAGAILLDGVDLRDYRLADLRSPVRDRAPGAGAVLDARSPRTSPTPVRPRPQDEIEAAAKAANVHDFIVALPDGYETQVGERGMRLSGGERQRISLARAFLKDAPILILDEPTSSVDVDTEAVIMEAMERLMAGRTSFMIAHRAEHARGQRSATRDRPWPDRGDVERFDPKRHAPEADSRRHARRGRGHPAVVAWSSLGGARPREVDVLKASRRRRDGVYRLAGAGPGGSPVIAKICKRKTAEVETVVYEELLPRLSMPSLRYYGKVRDDDRQHWWLFLEDVGAEGYSPADPEHRRLAGRWLAAVQLQASEFLKDADLPDRGQRHYLVHLLSSRAEIDRQVRLRNATPSGSLVLLDLLSKLDMLEARWGEVADFCDTLPRTLVHGDFVSRNLRIMHEAEQERARDLRLGDRGSRGSVSRPGATARAPARRARTPASIEAVPPVLRESMSGHLPLGTGRLCGRAGCRDTGAIFSDRRLVSVHCRDRLDLHGSNGRLVSD